MRFAIWMLVSFLIGIVTATLFIVGGRSGERSNRAAPAGSVIDRATTVDSDKTVDSARPADVQRAKTSSVPSTPTPSLSAATASQQSVEDAIEDLRDRDLLVPVQGVTRKVLRDSFAEARDAIREHEAIDILAPRRTAVLAVEDGTIVKFFTSVRGGLTIYQFDPSQTYAYYYAHLDGYASGLSEGDRVTRGQTIGFVGTSGNAPDNTPHLHFTIFLLTDKKQWWHGTAINPYDVWKK